MTGVNILVIDTYPRAIDFPLEPREYDETSLLVDHLNINDELRDYCKDMKYGLIGLGTYLVCTQKYHYLSVIQCTNILIKDANKIVLAARCPHPRVSIDLVDDAIVLRGKVHIVTTSKKIIVEDRSELYVVCQSPPSHYLQPGWTREEVLYDEVFKQTPYGRVTRDYVMKLEYQEICEILCACYKYTRKMYMVTDLAGHKHITLI